MDSGDRVWTLAVRNRRAHSWKRIPGWLESWELTELVGLRLQLRFRGGLLARPAHWGALSLPGTARGTVLEIRAEPFTAMPAALWDQVVRESREHLSARDHRVQRFLDQLQEERAVHASEPMLAWMRRYTLAQGIRAW